MTIDLKDPFLQKSILAGIGLGAVLYLFFGTSVLPMCYRPRAEEIRVAKDEMQRLSSDLAKAKQTANGLKSLQEQYAKLERDWEQAQALMPEKSELPEFLSGVTRSGLDCGLEVLMFEPRKTVKRGLFAASPVAVRVAGQYHQMGEFLSRVASLPRLVNISNLKVRERTGGDDEEHTVEAELILSAYYLDDSASSQAGETADAKTASGK